ncbi:hypothetical protein ACFFX0_18860 [Citricoccus parietis]|uniref:Uncharacterized protein n=1 Tax=Citricoccus parietis TaxID=592307 RepID=A0ABV5G2K6_9MICC
MVGWSRTSSRVVGLRYWARGFSVAWWRFFTATVATSSRVAPKSWR